MSNKIIINDYEQYLDTKAKKKLLKIFNNNFDLIIKTLKLDHNFPIMNFYLFPSEEIKIQETGEDGYAETDPETFSIYMVYNNDIQPIGPHEQVHLLTKHISVPNFVFSEGLAEFFEPYWRGNIDDKLVQLKHDEWVKKFITDGNYIPIVSLFDDYQFWELDKNATISYPETGSFIKYLTNEYGVEKIIDAYRQMRRRPDTPTYNYKIFKNVFNISVAAAEKSWLESLRLS